MNKYMTVYPEKGNEKFVAEALLSAADHPDQVQVDSRPRPDAGRSNIGFRVPVEVFDRFQALLNTPAPEGADTSRSFPVADAVEEKSEPVPPRKKAGRPKKVEEAE